MMLIAFRECAAPHPSTERYFHRSPEPSGAAHVRPLAPLPDTAYGPRRDRQNVLPELIGNAHLPPGGLLKRQLHHSPHIRANDSWGSRVAATTHTAPTRHQCHISLTGLAHATSCLASSSRPSFGLITFSI